MGRKTLSASFILFCLLAGTWAASPNPVRLLDENGALLGRAHYVWLSRQRVLVPLRVYERLGFDVRRDFRRGTAKLAVPHSTTHFTFSLDTGVVGEPAATTGDAVKYERPVFQMRGHEFYIAPMALKDYFPNLISTRWDSRIRTVTIQRLHEMNRLLRLAG